MPKSRKKRKTPKRVLALPDLEQAKSAVLNTLTSKSGQRTYDHAISEFVEWYCSEPRLAFNRTVVLRYRINLEQRYAPSTINLPSGSPTNCLRGCRLRLAQPGIVRRHSPRKGRTPLGRTRWKLAYRRARGTASRKCNCGYPARPAQPRHAVASHRMWPSTGRTSWPKAASINNIYIFMGILILVDPHGSNAGHPKEVASIVAAPQ